MAEYRGTEFIWEKNYNFLLREPNDTYDPLADFIEQADYFIQAARGVRKKDAASHRDLLVGACVLANNTEEGVLRAYLGFNDSPRKGVKKRCAEKRATERAIGAGFTRREAFVVAGPTDQATIESVVFKPMPLLPPCDVCRELIDDSAVVMAVGEEDNALQIYTGQQLRKTFEQPIEFEKRRRKRQTATPELPQPIEFRPGDHKFWRDVGDAYAELDLGLHADSEREMRLRRAENVVAATYQVAA